MGVAVQTQGDKGTLYGSSRNFDTKYTRADQALALSLGHSKKRDDTMKSNGSPPVLSSQLQVDLDHIDHISPAMNSR